jgi:hypothetical protein
MTPQCGAMWIRMPVPCLQRPQPLQRARLRLRWEVAAERLFSRLGRLCRVAERPRACSLMTDAGFAPGLSGDYPGHMQATHPNGVRFRASGIACDDPEAVRGCDGIILLVDVSVKTMQTVLRYPDEEVTWEAINQANAEVNLVTTYFDQPRNALIMKRVLLLGGGGQAVANIKAEIAFIAENAKLIMDGYIWPKG